MNKIYLVLIAILTLVACKKEEKDEHKNSSESVIYRFEMDSIIGGKALLQIETTNDKNQVSKQVYEYYSANNDSVIQNLVYEFQVAEDDKVISIRSSRVSTLHTTTFKYQLLSDQKTTLDSGKYTIQNNPFILNYSLK